MPTIAVSTIRAYRHYVSPYKGFRCAHNVLHGCGSCSDFGLRAFSRYGLVKAVRLQWRRFDDCRMAMGEIRRRRELWVAMAAAGSGEGTSAQAEEEKKSKKKGSSYCDPTPCPGDLADVACHGSRSIGNIGDGLFSADICAVGDACSCIP